MAVPPPFRSRLSLLWSAMKWAWTGSAHTARQIQVEMEAVQPEVKKLAQKAQSDAEQFSASEFNPGTQWAGDVRWSLLLGSDSVNEKTRRGIIPSVGLSWQLGWALAHRGGAATQRLFFTAVKNASLVHESTPKSREVSAKAPVGSDEYRNKRAQTYRETDTLTGHALASVFPQKLEGVAGWDEAWSTFIQSKPSNEAFSTGVLIATLSSSTRWTHSLPHDWLDRLKSSPVPWPIWMVLRCDADGLDQALRAPGGLVRWAGVTKPWALDSSLLSDVRRVGRAFRQALMENNVEPLVSPDGATQSPRKGDLGLLLSSPMTLADRAASLSAVECIEVCGRLGLHFGSHDATPLDDALRDDSPHTAHALVVSGALLESEKPGGKTTRGSIWNALYASPIAQSDPDLWLGLEKAFWNTRPRSFGPDAPGSARLNLLFDAIEHPLAFASAHRLLDTNPVMCATSMWAWKAVSVPGTSNPSLMRSPVTLVAHGDWPQAEKDRFISRVFKGADIRVNRIMDDFWEECEQLVSSGNWREVVPRSVPALTWALVYAPACVPDLLARSTSHEIQEALELAGATVGWLEGDVASSAKALNVSRSWQKWRPAWFQASLSVDPGQAFASLAGHPQTLADLLKIKSTPVEGEGTMELSGLDLVLMFQPTHVTGQILDVAGQVGVVSPQALRRWVALPRDLPAVLEGVKKAGWLSMPATAEGGTLLAHAIETRDKDLAQGLLEAGADPGLPDQRGNTPMSLAEQAGMEWTEMIASVAAQRMASSLPAPTTPPTPRSRF